jgi:hypothetical protein
VFLIIAVLLAAIAYEALQALNRFASLTRDDIPKFRKQSQNSRPDLTSPLVL